MVGGWAELVPDVRPNVGFSSGASTEVDPLLPVSGTPILGEAGSPSVSECGGPSFSECLCRESSDVP